MMKTIRLALLALLIGRAAHAAPNSAPTTASATTTSAAAHAPLQGYMFVLVYTDSTQIRLELAIPDVIRALSLPWDPKGVPTREQVTASLSAIRAYIDPKFAVGDSAARLTPAFRDFGFRKTESGDFLMLLYVLPKALGDQAPITMTPFFEFNEATRRNLVVVQHNWKGGILENDFNVSLILSPDEPTQTLDLSESSLFRGFVALVKLGVWHIWIGLDHILFLMALVLPSVLRRENGRWIPAENFRRAFVKILTIVSCFTIAHTITLSLAALGLVDVPSRLVESVIALSIAIAALHNLWPVAKVNEAAIAFIFGLFHGFGFATVLGSLGLGTEHLVLSLLGFNVGVELGQVAIIAAVFPVLFLVRRLRIYSIGFRLGSVGLIMIGLLWVAERSLNFNVPLVPIAKSLLGMKSTTPT